MSLVLADDFEGGVGPDIGVPYGSDASGVLASGLGPDGSDAWETSTTPASLVWTAPSGIATAKRWRVALYQWQDSILNPRADAVVLRTNVRAEIITYVGTSGELVVEDSAGNTLISTSAGVIVANTWQLWEIDANLSQAVVSVAIDGQKWVATWTPSAAGMTWERIDFSITAGTTRWDKIRLWAGVKWSVGSVLIAP